MNGDKMKAIKCKPKAKRICSNEQCKEPAEIRSIACKKCGSLTKWDEGD